MLVIARCALGVLTWEALPRSSPGERSSDLIASKHTIVWRAIFTSGELKEILRRSSEDLQESLLIDWSAKLICQTWLSSRSKHHEGSLEPEGLTECQALRLAVSSATTRKSTRILQWKNDGKGVKTKEKWSSWKCHLEIRNSDSECKPLWITICESQSFFGIPFRNPLARN